ncbi:MULTISPECIES: hypothetical protein [unclassified Anabaena]|nr:MULTISPECIES: hypothetical protein [unclassified Anabaena]
MSDSYGALRYRTLSIQTKSDRTLSIQPTSDSYGALRYRTLSI